MMKKYNFVCCDTFTSKKGEKFFKICFCDVEGVYTFFSSDFDSPVFEELYGESYLKEFDATVFFYYGKDGQRRCIITACEVK